MTHTSAGTLFTDLVLEIFRLNGALLDEGDRLTSDLGLTSSRWQVMGAISERPLPVPHIANEMGLTRQGVQKIANTLKREGLVDLQNNPHHKSSKLVSLTPEGRKRLAAIDKIQSKWAEEIAAEHGAGELSDAHRIIHQLRVNLERKTS